MKCPLTGFVKVVAKGDAAYDWKDCLKEECAWWGTHTVNTSTEATGCCLSILTEILSEIMSKMPHVGQFKS